MKKYIFLFIATAICAFICVSSTVFVYLDHYGYSDEILKVKNFAANILNMYAEPEYPEETVETTLFLNTTDKGSFAFDENSCLFVSNDSDTLLIDINGIELENFYIDLNNNTTWFTADGREYTLISKEITSLPKKIEPTVWKDNKGIVKLYSAIPINDTKELLIYTDVSDISEDTVAISLISNFINQLTDNLNTADKLNIILNGMILDVENLSYVTSAAITSKDNSFLTTTPYTESQLSNLKKLYSEEIFNSWQTSSKISKDEQNRNAYVRIIDDIRYTLFAEDEDFETANIIFGFNDLTTEGENYEN